MGHLINNKADFKEMMNHLRRFNTWQVDSETTGLHFLDNQLITIQLGAGGNQYTIDCYEIPINWIGDQLRPYFESRDYLKILHNALFDCCFFAKHLNCMVVKIYDTMLAEKVIIGGTNKLPAGLGPTLKRYEIANLDKSVVGGFIGYKLGEDKLTPELLEYAYEDVTYLEELKEEQALKATSSDMVIIGLENRCVEVTYKMRYYGMKFDKDKWGEIAKKNLILYNESKSKLPSDIESWDSHTQVKKYFKSNHNITIKSYTDLDQIASENNNEILNNFIKYRATYQNVKLFGEAWMKTKLTTRAPIVYTDTVHNGRVHCNYNQIIASGRFSCSQPNLQQIPSHGEHRHCFLPNEGCSFVIADYSSQEIAIAAVMSGEKLWVDTILNGGDIHGEMAAKMFGQGYTKDQRQIAKKVNFAILYGGGSYTVSLSTGLTKAKAQQIINSFKSAVPKLSKWLRDNANKGKKYKEATSLINRRRDLSGMANTYTVSMNHPIQSTGADIIKLAMCYVDKMINEKYKNAYIAHTQHDELICNVPNDKVESFVEDFRYEMERASTTILGVELIKAEPEICKRWEKI